MDRTATSAIPSHRLARGAGVLAVLSLSTTLAVSGCKGDTGDTGPAGTGTTPPGSMTTPTEVPPQDDAPEVIVEIRELTGATGPGGAFLAGDRITVHFRVEKEDGSPWQIQELARGRTLVSGPTTNYQRVIPIRADVLDGSVSRGDGVYSYAFPVPIRAKYAAPYNNSPSFKQSDGEMAGQALVDGTYTLGLAFTWDYTVDGVAFRRAGDATVDFRVGNAAGALAPRAVSSLDNCNRCHVELSAHEGAYRSLTMCLMCHTSGAEDLNDPAIGGGTPGVSIDSRVLFHRIHAGRSLPSVLGVTTLASGNRRYTSPKKPLVFADKGGLHDFSSVGWPGMPHRVMPLPRDVGYSSLPPINQWREDTIRSGAATCDACHGDPDGAGPIAAPEQGRQIYSQMSRRACGACHDDVDFTRNYRSNNRSMPPQANDSACFSCHGPTTALSPEFHHRHPIKDAGAFSGVHVSIDSVVEAGVNDGDGTFDPGEKILVRAFIQDDDGVDIDPARLASTHAILSGPTGSHQVVLETDVLRGLLSGGSPFEFHLPETRYFERLGDATASIGDVFQTARTPITRRDQTELVARTGLVGAPTTSVAVAGAGDNHLDVVDGSVFARNDVIVVDDGVVGREEYVQVQWVDGNRLWFSAPNRPDYAPGLTLTHLAGAAVSAVALAPLTFDTDYSLDGATGTITELVEFGSGSVVLATYYTDFVFPSVFPQALNASPSVDDRSGKWAGKSIVDGTYTFSFSASRDVRFRVRNESTAYIATSEAATHDILVGSATALEPYTRVDGQNCEQCHVDLLYHDGAYRGYATCILCHGSGGAEDVPRYVAANAPDTPGVTVDFRSLIHRVHTGHVTEDPSFEVVRANAAPYPDNFAVKSFAKNHFPAMPGGTMQCDVCHASLDATSILPGARGHPTEQERPVSAWTTSCAGCHDSSAAVAHMEAQTAPSGAESCLICHAVGQDTDAVSAHRTR